MMKKLYPAKVCTTVFFLAFFSNAQTQQVVQKTNPMKVYMHYMPWFETPASIGKWGWHWTMNNQNPNIVGPDGHRQIASHYYPLIGPYASRDKDVIEYHLLLMKLSGVDGVLINWYGVDGSNGDIKDLLRSSDSIVSYMEYFAMKFGVVMEDQFSQSIDDVITNMIYLGDYYFTNSQYIRIGAAEEPLVLIFGPAKFQLAADWTEILSNTSEEIEFLTLWYQSGEAGTNADGEFSWVYQDNSNHITHLENFLKNKASTLKTAAGSAYPGFEDFYEEGGAGSGYFTILPDSGSTLDATFAKVEQYKTKLDMLQLVTFNDFGEGTMFEPTVETGFTYLKKLQSYTGVSYGETELKLVHRLYLLRKEYFNNSEIQKQLNEASDHLRNLEISDAATILNGIQLNTAIQQSISDNMSDNGPVIWPNPYKSGELNIGFETDFLNFRQLNIYDMFGKKIHESKLEKGVSGLTINNLNLSQGVYFIHIQNENSLKAVKFLVIE